MGKFLAFLGLPYMDTVTLVIVLGLAFAAALISGWLADLIMDEHSFGIPMNGIVLIAGSIVGLVLLKHSGMQFKATFLVVSMICASISAVALLLLMAFLKRFI